MQGKEKHCERKFGGIFVDCDGKRIGRPSGSFPANGTRNPRFRPNASRRGPTSLDICLGNSPPPASDRFTGWSNARQIKAGCILLPGAALLLHIAGGQPQIHGIIDHPAVLVGGDAPPDAVLCGLEKGGVLAHDTGDEAAGVGLVPCGHLVEDGKTVVDVAGQGQMPQDDALL